MNVLIGLLSLAALSLFLGWFFRRPAALMPIVAVSAAMLFFMLFGCAGQLRAGGYLWYALCAAALVFTLFKMKKNVLGLITPGFVLFLAGSALFVLLFAATQPMFSVWDEFTFWGTAAKITSQQNVLFTHAHSSLIARTYPPGLIVFSYMMQFFGGFSEHGTIAAYAVVYMAAFAAGTAVWGKNKSASVVFFAAFAALPVFFEINRPAGQMMRAFLNIMADFPMAVLFGGALCFYFAGGEKGGRLLLPFGVILAALTSVKDMGLALAMCALFCVALDMFFCERERLRFVRLKGGAALAAACAYGVLMIAASYQIWAMQLGTIAVDRFNLASGGGSLGPVGMLVSGIKMLFGMGRTEQFTEVVRLMLNAFFTRPVFLFGSGAMLLVVILAVSGAAFVLNTTHRQRKRVVVFTLGMAVCFAAFYVFNIFTYAIIFKPNEAGMLREYERYIGPFWVAWLMGALVLLARAATYHRSSFYRLRMARCVACVLCGGIVAGSMVRGNWHGNFLNVSPSLYTERRNVQAVATAAKAEGENRDDVIYIISQGDNGTRFYIMGYELSGIRVPQFVGMKKDELGKIVYDKNNKPVLYGESASTLVSPDKDHWGAFDLETTQEEWMLYLKHTGCTHVLLDVVDGYILEDFKPLFSDRLKGWGKLERGNTYYRIVWADDGTCTFEPQKEVPR